MQTTTMIPSKFATDRFDLVHEDRICVTDFRFGRNREAQRDVWIESSDKGKRFLSQITSEGETYNLRKGIYTKDCYFLREKSTGRFYFLDRNDCGFWLQGAEFSGAETFSGDESVKIQKWLTGFAN